MSRMKDSQEYVSQLSRQKSGSHQLRKTAISKLRGSILTDSSHDFSVDHKQKRNNPVKISGDQLDFILEFEQLGQRFTSKNAAERISSEL